MSNMFQDCCSGTNEATLVVTKNCTARTRVVFFRKGLYPNCSLVVRESQESLISDGRIDQPRCCVISLNPNENTLFKVALRSGYFFRRGVPKHNSFCSESDGKVEGADEFLLKPVRLTYMTNMSKAKAHNLKITRK